ncbi:hypothetical protein [Aromatoleum anaerobium]|uniref:hypothetical protein n=1 Tax=Aromatoleum anaerobium TaxID=182180 RepID=UPI001FF2E165|nr:hypothetical protein [Aromatoleum anaerobium]MCK0507931.1 hypothetical protein [Aromatoleum anaerobium]
MSTPKCALGRLLPNTPDLEEVKRRGYYEDGILVIDMRRDHMDWTEREIFRQWAEKRYRKPKAFTSRDEKT